MKSRLVYEWDVETQRKLSVEELKLLADVSRMLRGGCRVRELNKKLKMLNLEKFKIST